jgi:hypothetical protein
MAGIALDQAIPLNRVWSFPKNLVLPSDKLVIPPGMLLVNEIDRTAWERAEYWFRAEDGHIRYWVRNETKPRTIHFAMPRIA